MENTVLKTEAEHTEAAKKAFQDAADSFERSDTDGFASQWCSNLSGELERTKAELAKNGGMSTFTGLFRKSDGSRVRAKVINGTWGPCWAFCNERGGFTGQFLPYGRRSRKQKAEGFYEADEQAPAFAKLDSPPGARGFSGLSSVFVRVFRTDGGYPEGAK